MAKSQAKSGRKVRNTLARTKQPPACRVCGTILESGSNWNVGLTSYGRENRICDTCHVGEQQRIQATRARLVQAAEAAPWKTVQALAQVECDKIITLPVDFSTIKDPDAEARAEACAAAAAWGDPAETNGKTNTF